MLVVGGGRERQCMSGTATRKIARISDEALLAAAEEARHMRDLLQRLGLAAYGGNYESIRGRLERLGALEDRFCPRGTRVGQASYDIEDGALREAVRGARSRAEVLRRLHLPVTAAAYKALRRALDRAQIDVADLPGQAWRRGRRDLARVPLEALLVVGRARTVGHIKQRLIRERVLDACCSSCGIREWLGRPAPLELDHINGDRRDNRLENLRLLCPNCHALTPTYRGRNIGRLDLRPPALGSPATSPGGGRQT